MDNRNEDELYEKARKRVSAKRGFYQHLVTYVLVNLFLIIFFVPKGARIIPLASMLGWGIGLASHYLKVFGWPGSGIMSDDWEEDEVQREFEKMKRRRGANQPSEDGLKLKEIEKRLDEDELI